MVSSGLLEITGSSGLPVMMKGIKTFRVKKTFSCEGNDVIWLLVSCFFLEMWLRGKDII